MLACKIYQVLSQSSMFSENKFLAEFSMSDLIFSDDSN